VAFLVFINLTLNAYGSFSCDVRLRRYLWGVGGTVVLQIVFLMLLAAVSWRSAGEYVYIIMQMILVTIEVMTLVWAVIGLGLLGSSSTCHLYLHRLSIIVVFILWIKSVIFVASSLLALVIAYINVCKGSALNSLSIDNDSDSDSESEKVTGDTEDLEHK